MVITRIAGGLGNQLFQYYTGWNVAQRLDRPLYADISACLAPESCRYLLADLGLGRGINIEKDEVKAAIFHAFNQHHRTVLQADPHKELYKVILEKDATHYSEELWQEAGLSCICLLEGRWQSYQYLEGLSARDYASLQMSCLASDYWYHELMAGGAVDATVALHIRTGDMTLQQEVYQPTPLSYYQQAIAEISRKLSRPRFILFADDWTDPIVGEVAALVRGRACAAEKTGMDELERFRLMARMKNHILGNSTFGWWAAYLAEQLWTDHRWTLVPDRWYVQEQSFNQDLIPPHWVRITVSQ